MSILELETLAIELHVMAAGLELQVWELDGWRGDDSHTAVATGTPFRIRTIRTSFGDLFHWNDDWLDPYWNVELVEQHPDAAMLNACSLWVYGPSAQI